MTITFISVCVIQCFSYQRVTIVLVLKQRWRMYLHSVCVVLLSTWRVKLMKRYNLKFNGQCRSVSILFSDCSSAPLYLSHTLETSSHRTLAYWRNDTGIIICKHSFPDRKAHLTLLSQRCRFVSNFFSLFLNAVSEFC